MSLLIPTFISIYYNILISYSLIYAISSFLPNLPWASCEFSWNDENCCLASVEGALCGNTTESPSYQYFYKYVLNHSESIGDFGGVNWKLAVSLLASWLFVYLSLIKGVQSLGKISYITAIFPYVMIFILIIRGVTLDGAGEGIKFYIGNIDLEKLSSLETWTDATSQVYFILGIASGGLYTLGRHNKFNYNHQKTAAFIAVLDALTGILAGFAIFSVLGYMAKRNNVAIEDLAVGGPGLAFIVYPEALSLMPLPWIWCVFFFLMMITIGFGSILSLVECVLNSISEQFAHKLNTKTKKMVFRLGICIIFYVVAFPLATNSSLYIQNLIDTYLSGWPFYIFAFFEAFGLSFIYGFNRLKSDITLMLGFAPNIYWSVGFITAPILTFVVLIIFTIQQAQDSVVKLNDYEYPIGATIIGWFIVAIVILPFPIYFIMHIWKSGPITFDKAFLQKLLKPDDDWKPALPAHMRENKEENDDANKAKSDEIELRSVENDDQKV